MATKPLSFYIHVPYCVKRCGYCDFNTYTPSELNGDLSSVSSGYIDQLITESKIAKREIDSEISTIFIGGGTPTLLEPSDFKKLLDHLENEFGFARRYLMVHSLTEIRTSLSSLVVDLFCRKAFCQRYSVELDWQDLPMHYCPSCRLCGLHR